MYKSYRIIDGKSKWVVVDDGGNIINKDPCNEELKILEVEKKSGYRKYIGKYECCVCGIELIKGMIARKEYKNGMWTGRWLCDSCRKKIYYVTNQSDKIKSTANSRTGLLDPNSTKAKGDMFEELTCEWRGVKNLNLENDNFNSPIDHSMDQELGIIQTKGKFYDHINGKWGANWVMDHEKKFDCYIFYCADKDGNTIERIYIFPKSEVIKRDTISIYKNIISKRGSWVEKYRVKDDDTLKIVNDIWKKIIKRRKIERD